VTNLAEVNAATVCIKGKFLIANSSFLICILTKMEVVIDYEFLRGNQDEVVVKELSLAAKNVIHTFHFQSPYGMTPHGSDENGLNWDNGHIPYRQKPS